MNGDEMSRGIMNQQNRKSNLPKHSSYSPSSNYGLNNYSNGYNSGNSAGYNGQQQQHQRRRADHRFKNGSNGHHSNYNERLVKQNDLIIKLLKEIRDRLPAPPVESENAVDQEYFEQVRQEQIDQIDDQIDNQIDAESMDESEVMEPVDNQEFSADQEQDSYRDDDHD